MEREIKGIAGIVVPIAALVAAVGCAIVKGRPPEPQPMAKFTGFREELVQKPNQTTYRERDGAAAYDFWYFPLIDITADINGSFEILWEYDNKVDGIVGYRSGTITNMVTLEGGRTTRVELRDTGPTADPTRGESIAYGDPEGMFDGVWHAFSSTVSVTVRSPSGAEASATGVLSESFKSMGALALSFAGFREEQSSAHTAAAIACPVCGTTLSRAAPGVDVKCPSCGFVSAWTRR